MTSKRTRLALAAVVTVVMTFALGALSQVPYESDTAQHAVVRLAWRSRSVRVEECRRLTPEELEDVPAHMRREEVCEGQMVPYQLTVLLSGATVVDELVRAAGAREDRPLYVSHELPVEPGGYDLAVRFERQGDVPADASSGQATPAELLLEQRVVLRAKDVVLVTYDAALRRLVVVNAEGNAPRDR